MSALTPSPTSVVVGFPDPTAVLTTPAVGYRGTYVLELQQFGDAGWQDITAYAISATWKWGRDYASQFGGRAQPFEAHVTLRSAGGLFSKYNSASPYLTMLGREGRIRLRMTDPVTATLFYGYVLSSDVASNLGYFPTVQVNATGIMGYLAKAQTSSYLAGTVAYAARGTTATLDSRQALVYALAGMESPFGSPTITGDTSGVGLFDVWYETEQLFPAAVRRIEASEAGYIGDNREGTITYHNRHHRILDPRSATVQATWSDHEGAVLGPAAARPADGTDQYNRSTLSVPQYTFGAPWPDWELVYTDPREGSPDFYLDQGQTLRVQFDFPLADSPQGALLVNHHQFGEYTAGNEAIIVANSAPDGSGIDLTLGLSIASYRGPFAQRFDVTYVNNGAERMYFPTFRISGQLAYATDPVVFFYEDTASVAAEGPLEYPIDAPFVSPADGIGYVSHIVTTYKDVHPVLEWGFRANHSAAMLEEVVTREVADRIHIELDGTGPLSTGIGLVGDFFVEACDHQVTFADAIHTALFKLSPADLADAAWVLNQSLLSIDTTLTF